MHAEILTKEQVALLLLVKDFNKSFYLVGGTAIALQIGHRESIDFDLFNFKSFKNLSIKNKISVKHKINNVLVDKLGEFTFILDNVQFTFFQYPFKIEAKKEFDKIIKMPNLVTLAAMKAYELGRRAKWKDYVDMYFIIRDYYSVSEISKIAKQIFGSEFNEKLFRTQLAFFEDIDYTEKVIFMPGFEVGDEEIRKELIRFSIEK